jgi:AcrR family transcriptional regulator
MSPPKRDAESTAALRTSLVEHALHLIARDGADALTMRSLAAEAGCAVGLPYKVFADRHALVVDICHAEFSRISGVSDEMAARAGLHTVGANLLWFAELLLDSPAVALTKEIFADGTLDHTVAARVHEADQGPGDFESVIATYLALEQDTGRVRRDVDTAALGFLIAGALHNLVVSGEAWPRPSRADLAQRLDAVATSIAPFDES